SDADHAADVAVGASELDGSRLRARPPEVVVAVEISSRRSPGNLLQVGEKGMAQLGSPVTPELASAALRQQLIRPSEQLVIDESASVDVPKTEPLLPGPIDVNSAPHQVVFAKQQ